MVPAAERTDCVPTRTGPGAMPRLDLRSGLRAAMLAAAASIAGCGLFGGTAVDEGRLRDQSRPGVVETVRTLGRPAALDVFTVDQSEAMARLRADQGIGARGVPVPGEPGAENSARAEGAEVVVRLESGELRAVLAPPGSVFRPGDSVRLVTVGGITWLAR